MHQVGGFVIAGVVALLLGGCAAQVSPTQPPTSLAGAPSAAPASAAPVTETPLAESPESNGLDARTAYELCISMVGEGVESQGYGPFLAVSFDQAEVVRREDGYFWVWADYKNGAGAEQRDDGAAHCIVGGSVASPEWVTMSQASRSYRHQFDSEEPLSNYRG